LWFVIANNAFQSFVVIGARVAMLVMSLVPPITAFLGWIILGETMTLWQLFAMTVTVSGIILVMLKRKKQEKMSKTKNWKNVGFIIGLYLLLVELLVRLWISP
jgi:drug/metabolite transporter (DMT)-like permease